MTGDWFDAVARAMAGARTRRAVLFAFVAGLAIGVLGHGASSNAGGEVTAASCRGEGAKCRKGGQCCSGRCKKRHGKHNTHKKKGKCRCSPYLSPCSKDSDCCAFETPLVCVKTNPGSPGKCET